MHAASYTQHGSHDAEHAQRARHSARSLQPSGGQTGLTRMYLFTGYVIKTARVAGAAPKAATLPPEGGTHGKRAMGVSRGDRALPLAPRINIGVNLPDRFRRSQNHQATRCGELCHEACLQ